MLMLLVKKMVQWERKEKRAVATCGPAGQWTVGLEGLGFQSGSELDESVYSATISDIPSSSLFLPEEVPFEERLCWGAVSPWTDSSRGRTKGKELETLRQECSLKPYSSTT